MTSGIDQIESLLADLERQGTSPHTVRNYRADLLAFQRWFDGANHEDFAASLITPTDVREYRGYLQTVKRLVPATINRHLATLRAFTSWAVVKGYLEKLPTAEISGPQTPAWEPRWLDRKDERAMVRAVERYGTPRDVALIVTPLQTGLRVGELVALELEDLELSPRKGAVTVRHGKRDLQREVPLNAEARRVIERYLEVRSTSSSPRVFLGQRGAIGPEAVQRLVIKYAHLAQLGDVTPHTLRHTFAKRVLEGGTRRSLWRGCWGMAASRRRRSTPSRVGTIASRPSRGGVARRICRAFREKTSMQRNHLSCGERMQNRLFSRRGGR